MAVYTRGDKIILYGGNVAVDAACCCYCRIQSLTLFFQVGAYYCGPSVCQSEVVGPFDEKVAIHIGGEIDDDLGVNGVVPDFGSAPFTDAPDGCTELSGTYNGLHSFANAGSWYGVGGLWFYLEAGQTVELSAINNFRGYCGGPVYVDIYSPSAGSGYCQNPGPLINWTL